MTDDWQPWIGRGEEREDRLNGSLLRRWLATLDRSLGPGDAAPQAIHWCLCTPEAETRMLGPDGHPAAHADGAGSYLPPSPLPRRMWASSRIEFHRPLHGGQAIVRRSKTVDIVEKKGGSGRLLFVDVLHETLGPAGLAVRETQTIVYREAAPAGAVPVPPPPGPGRFDVSAWQAHRLLSPSPTLLLRFSALTFNSHRIHYDLPYATGREGYRGLVVHGPLIATLLIDLAQRRFGDNALGHFAYRSLSPAICGEDMHLVLRGPGADIELGAFAADGRQLVAASASIL